MTRQVDPMISRYAVETLVCGSPKRRKKAKTRTKNGRKLLVVGKLDEEQVRWIIREKLKGELSNGTIAETQGVSVRWVQKLWARYKRRKPSDIVYPAPMGRPGNGLPGRREHSAVLSGCGLGRLMAVRLEAAVAEGGGMNITHHVIYKILKDEELVENQPRKARQRKWVFYERRFSNSLWHTDYKQLRDGRWFIAYQDDASRFIVGFGVYDEATTEHAIEVLEKAVKRHGRPAQLLTDHGSQFYANEKGRAARGASAFEMRLVELGIGHILARVRHPQTNGKLERFHLEIERHLQSFEEESAALTVRGRRPDEHAGGPFHTAGMTDPVTRLVEWYNNRIHMSLKDQRETPAQAYVRKQPPEDITVEGLKEDLHA